MQGIDRRSFYSIIAEDHYIIEIPIIQRDYAQGRKNPLTNEIRTDFLTELKQYVDSGKRYNDLDFVYGNIRDTNERNVLTLLDGQQRLTTLFLLHWYAALIEGEDKYKLFREIMLNGSHSRFTYKTRYSSTDFCDHLVKFYRNDGSTGEKPESLVGYYNDQMLNPNMKLSKMFKNEKWFNAYWNEDPTILSMLSMLDSIQNIFRKSDCLELFDKLTGLDGHGPAITFQFLNLDEYKLTDELYIKMNSRGRSLTRYENLKSKLLKEYELFSKTDEGRKFNLEVNKNPNKSFREFVSLKFDKDWTDMLWKIWLSDNNGFNEPVVDDMFLCLISNICINENINYLSAPKYDVDGNEIMVDIDVISKEIEAQIKKRNNIEYRELIELFKSNNYLVMKEFVTIMNFLVKDEGNCYSLNTNFDNKFWYIKEDLLFKNIVFDFRGKGVASYYDRINFYAYYKYFVLYKNAGLMFKNWMRFVSNIMNNSLIDNPQKFVSAIISINKILIDSKGDIRKYLIETEEDNIPKVGLSNQQVTEEKIKAELSQNPEWEIEIDNAESELEYFQGELNFPLEFYANVSAQTSELDVNDPSKLEDFKFAVKRLSVIFGKKPCGFPILLSRALLTKGNYLRPMGGKISFLTDTGKRARDLKWKTYLGDIRQENDIRRNCFSELLRSISISDCTDDKIQLALENICNQALLSQKMAKWQSIVIRTPEIFDVKHLGANYRYIEKISDDEIYVLGSDNRGKYYTELFSLAKYYELKNKKINISPFTEFNVLPVRGSCEKPGFAFYRPFIADEECDFSFIVKYSGNNKYDLSFNEWDIDSNNFKYISDQRIIDILVKSNFKIYPDQICWCKENVCECDLESEIKGFLYDLKDIKMDWQKEFGKQK